MGLFVGGDVRELLVQSNVARRAEQSSLEVWVCLSGDDVIGDTAVLARFLCERRVKVAGNFFTFMKYLQYDEREKKSFMKECREREYRRTFPDAGKMAQRVSCPEQASRGESVSRLNANKELSNAPAKPASRGNNASQPNANEQLSNGPTNSASRGKNASQLNANEQLSNGPTKVPWKEKSA